MEKSYVGMSNCYFCGEPNQILIDRTLKNTLPREVGVIDMTPCSTCEGYMKQGIIVMSICDDTTAEEMKAEKIEKYGRTVGTRPPNPVRTGGWVVVKEEAVRRILQDNESYLKFALSKRFLFITSEAWNALGFEPAVTLFTKQQVNQHLATAKK